jgi:hypothetical protein
MRRIAWALVLLSPVSGLEAGDTAFLPEVSVHLQAARYAPTETAFKWDGWVGAGAGFFELDGVTLHGTAEVETIIGNEKRAFDANQANYHLETGLRKSIGSGGVGVFFHHVSRHYVDRPKIEAVDWNVLGVRAGAAFPASFPVAGRVTAQIGHTTLASLVGYRWEARVQTEADLGARNAGGVYLLADARLVTREPSALFPEERFVDLTVEAGGRWSRGARTLRAFAAYERRNDVLLEAPGRKDRALLGLRVGFGESAAANASTSASSP